MGSTRKLFHWEMEEKHMSHDSAPVREMFINFAVVPHAAIICYWWVRVSFGVRIRVDVRVSMLIGSG